jgi:hypothetical protein
MRGAIPSLPNTPSWRGAQLKKAQGHLYHYHLHYNVKRGRVTPRCVYSSTQELFTAVGHSDAAVPKYLSKADATW